MGLSKQVIKVKDRERKDAISLYRQGYSTRAVGRMIGKSHAWVALAVKK